MDFVATNIIDAALRRLYEGEALAAFGKSIRLAVLSSATTTQLRPSLRIAALRREIGIELYENDFGQYWQELNDPTSALHSFQPSAVLFTLDARHLAAGVHAGQTVDEADDALAEVLARLRNSWQLARKAFGCGVIQQTALPVFDDLLGSNEYRLAGSRAGFIARLNAALPALADQEGVDLLALDARAARDGLAAWYNPALWHHAKQEINPRAAPLFGDLVLRLLAARLGRSSKCLVLDLDNTLWGGVIGDDGLDGIMLGQGSAVGEAFVAFQDYCRELSRRGVILAVCSKNDIANARMPFEAHPEMLLRLDDISVFVANWSDKAANLRQIAKQLNIGLDSLVFADDNPAERELVRRELPMVAVPELGDEPAFYPRIIAEAGYFEAVTVTEEDRTRATLYAGNRQREASRVQTTDIGAFLRDLQMQVVWQRFDRMGLQRIVQLINKTNQFNLTTRRATEAHIEAVMQDTRAFGLQLRLLDRFGDNGIIAVVIGRMMSGDEGFGTPDDLLLHTWLMSCRVLGRQVERATLGLIVEQARQLGARRLIGEYIPTNKNAMVSEHYTKLGFTIVYSDDIGYSRAELDLSNFTSEELFISMQEG
jgi:FkbH-like protein